jgi:hypothetical protein
VDIGEFKFFLRFSLKRSMTVIKVCVWPSYLLVYQLTLFADRFEDDEKLKKKVFGDWQKLIDHLESMNLMDAASIKPIVDGRRLQKDLNASPGPWMKEALDVCMAWQLRNPEMSESDPERAKCEAVEAVKRLVEEDELTIPLKKK